MPKWLLVRHGQTDWNARGLLQGHTDVPLNETGRGQARQFGERLASVDLDAAYSSDLLRCSQTLSLVLGSRDVSTSHSQRLREQAYGRWEGMSFSSIQAADPELYAVMVKDYTSFTPPGGEDFRAVEARSAAFVAEVRERHPLDTLLIVGHGASLRTLITCMTGLPLEAGWRFKINSCSLTVLEVGPSPAVMELLNDTSHLGRTL